MIAAGPQKKIGAQNQGCHKSTDGLQADGITVFCHLTGHEHEQRKDQGDDQRQKRRCANGGKTRLDDQQCADKADRAGGQTAGANLLLQNQFAQ